MNSVGTDNVPALVAARNYYGADMAAFSIPASEHSTATAGGRDGELEFMRAYLAAYPTGAISAVADSYDLWHFLNVILGKELRKEILERDGVLVVRPDSGDPVEIVPEVIEALMVKFGFDYTETGYKILNPKVRVIQGDGVDQASILKIMDAMMDRGLAIGNVVFGMGGGLHHSLRRRTDVL
ncbi:hypothetical protein [Salipiger mucosus]|uniref:Nicotinamide phosphoribosyltransferase n=1 Tax=Salipiger mucosus DSM 16094 TaxID=1123237 RepID=S9RVG4_9RHOB|nr:hypothetical protein [Salipiger mucosus]EPX77969.1 Nicotinamide phosphoribosyltransferase [Salipiger mucosus DSM 16094]